MSFTRISLLASAVLVALGMGACTTIQPQQAGKPPDAAPAPQQTVEAPKETLKPVTFAALPGWANDDLRQAWPALLASCEVLVKKDEWREPCAIARNVNGQNEKAVRLFFESFFVPYQVLNADGSDNGMVTGYYEPLLRGARKRGGPYQTPLHRAPEDLLTVDLTGLYPELKGMRL